MARIRHKTNPFYALLVVAGVAFTVTACAYGVMTFKATQPQGAAEIRKAGGLLDFLDRHGVRLMAAELAVLATATVAAIGTDGWWTRPAGATPESPSPASDRRQQI
ncbi:MAG: hypothetical protein HYX69_18550 [Planctomycetia bacterium]|nr:hypothetical protein [Planctomycetia bacterium]